MTESDIMRELERALCAADSPVRVWRQNAGLSRVDGRVIRGAPAGAAEVRLDLHPIAEAALASR